MNNIENLLYKNKVVATIIRGKTEVEGLKFFTEEKSPLQIAIHNHKKDKRTRLHSYQITKPIQILEAHKFIYIQKGKVEISFCDKTGKQFKKIKLAKGDIAIIKNIPHTINFFGSSKVFEVKQGPYLGELID